MKKILFLTGTRADFGKLKPLIRGVAADPELDYLIAATGMHLDDRYGRTETEIKLAGFTKLCSFVNHDTDNAMDLALARTIQGLSPIVFDYQPDLLVVHGDRIEALAGAIVGSLNNIRVAHVEGGEVSGTVDEAIRHAITKLSHTHFVAKDSARALLLQMGEMGSSVFVIGSPEVDIMLSGDLPNLKEACNRYEISFRSFAILIFHPVTTEVSNLASDVKAVIDATIASNHNYVVLYPNNDHGSHTVLDEMERLRDNPKFRVIPSIRFEHFQTLLRNAEFILGNSSSGVREAPVHGTPTVNIGTRQNRRGESPLIVDCPPTTKEILTAINRAMALPRTPSLAFGDGSSTDRFVDILNGEQIWSTPIQKSIAIIKET